MAKQRFRDIKKGNIQEVEAKPKKDKKSKKAQRAEGYIPYASIPDRIKAFITDQFMIMMPILYIVFYMVMGGREEFAEDMMMGWVYILVPNFIIVTLFLTFKGQTPGAKAYNLKLIDREGHTPSIWAVMFRYYIELLGFITIIGIFIPFFRKDRKSLQDVISATHFISLD